MYNTPVLQHETHTLLRQSYIALVRTRCWILCRTIGWCNMTKIWFNQTQNIYATCLYIRTITTAKYMHFVLSVCWSERGLCDSMMGLTEKCVFNSICILIHSHPRRCVWASTLLYGIVSTYKRPQSNRTLHLLHLISCDFSRMEICIQLFVRDYRGEFGFIEIVTQKTQATNIWNLNITNIYLVCKLINYLWFP